MTRSMPILLMLVVSGWAATANARPPTLQVSPGYDARLAESRKAWAEHYWRQTQPAMRVKKVRRVVPRR
jgi:hypothetical protein